MSLRTVGVRLTADVSQYMSSLKRAGAATKDFAGQLDKSAKAGNLDAVADRAAVAGIALAGMAGYAIKSAADFDKSMSKVKAATHAGTAEIGQLREAALQAGKDTQYSATGAADAITELSKAGVATADILGGGLKGALSLAAAGQLDVGEAAETAASALTQFKLKGSDIPHVADLLAAGAGKAQGSVHDMGMALNQSGLVAAQFGLSIEDTTGVLAEFASAGLLGSDAGTSFKTMLLAMANPSDITKNKMNELGISFYDTQGRFIGLSGVAQVLQDRLKGVSQETRQSALAQIFGNDAVRAASILYADGAAGVQRWRGAVDDAGYASKTAADLTDNLAGDIERLKGSLETLAIESGSGANGGMRLLVKGLGALVDEFDRIPGGVSSTLVVLAGVGGAVGLALAAFIKLRAGVARAVEELNTMGPAGEKAATGLGRVSSAAAKAGAALATLEIVGAIADHFGAASANVDQLTNALASFASTGKTSGELTDIFGNNLKDLGKNAQAADAATHGFWGGLNDLTSSIPGVNSLVDTLNERIYGLSFNQATENMQALDQALTQYMTTTGDARKASELWNRVLTESGLDTQQLADLLPNAWKKIGELNNAQNEAGKSGQAMADGTKAAAGGAGDVASATPGATKATKEYKNAADAAAAAADGQRSALMQLNDFMKAETDPVFAFIQAQKDLSKAEKDAKKAQDDLDKAIEKHGPKSKEAKAASDKLNESTRKLAESAVDLQGKTGALGDSFNGKLSPSLRKTLEAAGLTKGEIRNVEAQFKSAKKAADAYDDKYEAKASAPGAKEAQKQLEDAYKKAKDYDGTYQAFMKTPGGKEAEKQARDAWTMLNKFDGGWTAALHTKGYAGVANDLRHLLAAQRALSENTSVNEANRELSHFFASGGPVYGPGTGTSDSIPARLSAGEFVMKASSVDKLGVALLSYMNRNGTLPESVADATPGFAGGGIVMPFPTNVKGTKIPEMSYGVPGGGAPGYKWMERVIAAAFPGLHVISDYRPGAMTLTGNRSYHGFGRAVDYPPSKPLAEWINLHFMRATKELITPWNSLNIHNGARHTYTGAVWRQHNFAGGNAHDHWAMKHGGTITEPIFGVGASGRTYSFGENYQSERVTPNWQGGGGGGVTNVNVTINAPVGSQPREIGRQVADVLDSYCRGGGRVQLRGTVTA